MLNSLENPTGLEQARAGFRPLALAMPFQSAHHPLRLCSLEGSGKTAPSDRMLKPPAVY